MEDILSQKAAQTIQFCSPDDNCKLSARILLVNLLQSSRSTFSWGSFLSFFAFKEGMLGTPISVLGGWPTVSARYLHMMPEGQCCRDNVYGNSVHKMNVELGVARGFWTAGVWDRLLSVTGGDIDSHDSG